MHYINIYHATQFHDAKVDDWVDTCMSPGFFIFPSTILPVLLEHIMWGLPACWQPIHITELALIINFGNKVWQAKSVIAWSPCVTLTLTLPDICLSSKIIVYQYYFNIAPTSSLSKFAVLQCLWDTYAQWKVSTLLP